MVQSWLKCIIVVALPFNVQPSVFIFGTFQWPPAEFNVPLLRSQCSHSPCGVLWSPAEFNWPPAKFNNGPLLYSRWLQYVSHIRTIWVQSEFNCGHFWVHWAAFWVPWAPAAIKLPTCRVPSEVDGAPSEFNEHPAAFNGPLQWLISPHSSIWFWCCPTDLNWCPAEFIGPLWPSSVPNQNSIRPWSSNQSSVRVHSAPTRIVLL